MNKPSQALVHLARQRPTQTLQVGHQYRFLAALLPGEGNNKAGLPRQDNADKLPLKPQLAPPGARVRSGAPNQLAHVPRVLGRAAGLLSHQMDFSNRAFDAHAAEVFGPGGIDYYKDDRAP